MASKIAVIGDVNGRFAEVFDKLGKLQAKQSFAFAIIVGNLFASPETASNDQHQEVVKLLQGSISVPVQTYFALGRHSLPAAVIEKLTKDVGELCPNLTMLGRRTSVKTSEGFRIVAVGGKHIFESDEQMEQYTAVYTDKDVAVAKGYNDADILVTSDWPADILMGSKVPASPPKELRCIAELCGTLKPRYHFSTSTAFYEREPFFHPSADGRPITRFLSLAPFGNAEKQKWIYAFSLEPSAEPPTELPMGTTALPFSIGTKKRKMESQQDQYNSFRFSNGNGHHRDDRPRGKRRAGPPPAPSECFFCLSNPACETHMVGSLGTNSYLTIAKGPLTTKQTFSSLRFPGHLLLMPLPHTPTIAALDSDDERRDTLVEMQKYRNALHTMLSDKSADSEGHAQLGAVTFEISRSGGVHHHWQFLPIQADVIERGLVEAAFEVEAENMKYPKFVKKASEVEEVELSDFFKVMIWSETVRKEMAMPIDRGFRFDLQFGRRVLAKLLGLENRVQWRDCGQSKEEESADAEAFRKAFERYDFTLET